MLILFFFHVICIITVVKKVRFRAAISEIDSKSVNFCGILKQITRSAKFVIKMKSATSKSSNVQSIRIMI